MNLNKAIVAGNLTRDPELRTMPSGGHVVTFGLATNRFWKDQNGAQQKDTQFHNIVAFGKLAETTAKFLVKGRLALVEGRIQNRSYVAKDGQKRYTSEIVAEVIQFGPQGGQGGGTMSSQAKVADAPAAEPMPDVPVVSEDEETPKNAKRKVQNVKETKGKEKPKDDDEFDIEEDIPF
ncbi:hypothetical protein A3I45_01635 [Candidatus Uhrbacteria bacterium RIFCSPLOWO2_02_FULL_53_10]|uniref:Single-stranded DNA-binding protein n=1 Tax=Candidatus Uhrbacteria bacterium RIFCSPLOWO2_02_FULL_53_10 TaxID=1802411 RepID=A0A1F7VJ81_9BACT|nr:MAG: hypothetical protein A3I45_01635 [Candidatus Uhrbacteria bacterium RIFCSPLOWO2_02_FULL_53_10]